MRQELESARWAVTAVFGANGVLIASLVVRTPSLMQDLNLGTGQLGLVAALYGLAAVVAMQIAGGLTARYGSRSIVRATIIVLPLLLVGIGIAPDFLQLAAIQTVLGATFGLLDVGVNSHAVGVERALGRPIMNGCHAAWSIGSAGGALLGWGAAHLGMSRIAHYAVIAVVLVPLTIIAGRFLLRTHPDRGPAPPRPRFAWRTGWTRRVLVFGAMGATVLTAEAAVAGWSGVFLHDDRHSTLGTAALGFFAFSVCQTSGRLVGDAIQARTSAVLLLRFGAVTTAAGLTLVVLGPWAWLGIVGFAVMGLGLATSLPVLYGVVGRLGAGGDREADAGTAAMVARFTTMTYAGILVAPAVIGWVAEFIGLSWTLASLIPLLLAVAFAAHTADQPAVESSQARVGEWSTR